MPIVLYQDPFSGPCRAVVMAAQHLGIKLDSRLVDMFREKNMNPEFVAMNPQRTIPTIDDNGFYLWNSHTIMTYLANEYAPGNPIYPKDPRQRAMVDRLLYFDIGTLNQAQREYMSPELLKGQPADPEKQENMEKALALLEQFLEKTTYAAGNQLTLADFSIASTLSFIEEACGYSLSSYPKTSAYLTRMKKEIPNYEEINHVPLRQIKAFIYFLKSRK